MKIEHYTYIGVIILVMISCGSSSKSVKGHSEVERQEWKMTHMSGIGVVHGNARMSEGVSVTETEVHYSLPDSSGKQHIVKAVIRKSEIEKDMDVMIEAEDSMSITEDVSRSEHEDMEVEEEENRLSNIHSILLVFIVVAIALAVYKLG